MITTPLQIHVEMKSLQQITPKEMTCIKRRVRHGGSLVFGNHENSWRKLTEDIIVFMAKNEDGIVMGWSCVDFNQLYGARYGFAKTGHADVCVNVGKMTRGMGFGSTLFVKACKYAIQEGYIPQAYSDDSNYAFFDRMQSIVSDIEIKDIMG